MANEIFARTLADVTGDPYAPPNAAIDGEVAGTDFDELVYRYTLARERRVNLHKVAALVAFVVLLVPGYFVLVEVQAVLRGFYHVNGTAALSVVCCGGLVGLTWAVTRVTLLPLWERRSRDAFARTRGLAPEVFATALRERS